MLKAIPKDKVNLLQGVGSASLWDNLLERRHKNYMIWIKGSISKVETLFFMKMFFHSKRIATQPKLKKESLGKEQKILGF